MYAKLINEQKEYATHYQDGEYKALIYGETIEDHNGKNEQIGCIYFENEVEADKHFEQWIKY